MNKNQMKSQDILVLSKILTFYDSDFTQMELAQTLFMSQSEISESLSRTLYSGLYFKKEKEVNRNMFYNFIRYGLAVVFPQHPSEIVRGTPTAHSAAPLNSEIVSEEIYVWPNPKGSTRGQSIAPLFPSVPKAILLDDKLYEILALMDAVRVGKAREKSLALEHLERHIC